MLKLSGLVQCLWVGVSIVCLLNGVYSLMQCVNNVDFSVLKQEMTKCWLLVLVSCSKGYSWAASCMFPPNLSCSIWLKWLYGIGVNWVVQFVLAYTSSRFWWKVKFKMPLEIASLLTLTLGTLSVSTATSQLPLLPLMWSVSSVSWWRLKLFFQFRLDQLPGLPHSSLLECLCAGVVKRGYFPGANFL